MKILGTQLDKIATGEDRFVLQVGEGHDGTSDTQTVTLLPGKLHCTCRSYIKQRSCAHIDFVVNEKHDASLTAAWLAHSTDSYEWKVPLFHDKRLKMFDATLLLTPRARGERRWAVAALQVDADSNAKEFSNVRVAAGAIYHSVGVVTSQDGRDTMRALIATWVKTQIDSLGTGVACTKFSHEGSHVLTEGTDLICCTITGQCIECYSQEINYDPAADVPAF